MKKAKSFITLVSVHHGGGDESDERGRSQNFERVPGENPQMSMDNITVITFNGEPKRWGHDIQHNDTQHNYIQHRGAYS